MRVTIKEIARELGLSHSTVSRVLNDKQGAMVSEATRDRITRTAERMGYRPNRIAQALKQNSTNLIGVFLPDGRDHFFGEVLANLRLQVEQNGFELIPFPTSVEKVRANWMRLLRWDLDGVFVFDYLFYTEGLREALLRHKGYIPPMVGLFNHRSHLRDFVAIDFAPVMEELLAHFLAQGCARIGYMALPISFHPDEERFRAYEQFLKTHGLEPQHLPLPPAPNLCEAARLCIHAHMDAGKPLPEALFCQNDEIAFGAYRALRERGVAVPQTVMLAGCDDIPYGEYLETPLTTLALPVAEACRSAWDILRKRRAEPDSPALQVKLKAALKLRASTLRQAEPP